MAFDLKDYSASAETYEKLVKNGQASAEDWHKLGVSYHGLGKLAEASQALNKACEMNNTLKGAQGLLAHISMSQNKYPDAVRLYKAELSLSPQDPSLREALRESCWQAGLLLVSQKKWMEAIPYFEDGLTVPSKRSSGFQYELAKVFSQIKNKKKGLNYLAQAVKKDSSLKIQARRDPNLAYLRKYPEFRKIVKR